MEYKKIKIDEDDIEAPREDSKLVSRAQEGDVEAITTLYDIYHEKIFRYLRSQVSDHQLAEDFTGEVFTRMLAALPKYKTTSAPFQSWLFRIARNLLIDHYRTEKKRRPVSLEAIHEQSAPGGDPDTELDRKLALEQLMDSLFELTDEQREAIVLRFLVRLPIKEVAESMGKSEAAVKALQHRGLAALRLHFSGPEGKVQQ